MKIAKRNSGVKIGAIFTVCSLALTATYVVPIIAVLPGMLFETIAEKLVNNEPYSNVGMLTILLLSVLFLLILVVCLIKIRNAVSQVGQISVGRIIFVMSLMFFIVHSLVFYIYWGVVLDFASDGQLIFAAIISYPISSFAFVLIGLLIDAVKNKNATHFIQPAE